MKGEILVAGIGNIFLGDDAFGVEVVRRLAQRPLPNNICVRDFGIRSYDLAYALMDEWDLAILVDAVPRSGVPGTVYTIQPDSPVEGDAPREIDAHSMNPVAVLQMVSALGGSTGHLLVVGCEPASVEPDGAGEFGLSPPVEAAVSESIRIIEDLIARNNVSVA